MRRPLVRPVLLAGVGLLILLAGAAALWHPASARKGVDGRLLVLDAKTGRILHQRNFPGGRVVAALLAGGRIAVGDADACHHAESGEITVWDAHFAKLAARDIVSPCDIASLDAAKLRRRFGETDASLTPLTGPSAGLVLSYGAGRLVESAAHAGGATWLSQLTAYDAAGHVTWRRSVAGRHLGRFDARNGTILLPVLGDDAG